MSERKIKSREEVVIKFAGDSGDGMQLVGNEYTNSRALAGNDVATFPDFPAEIRAPAGTRAGVSGFQLHFGSREINTPGDHYDVLVAMNAAALVANLKGLRRESIVIVDPAGFDSKHLKLAKLDQSPLESGSIPDDTTLFEVEITRLTRLSLEDSTLEDKAKDQCRNMFVLGFVTWLFNRDLKSAEVQITEKFSSKPEICEANIKVLRSGYNYGETTESFASRYEVAPAELPPGVYRNIMGNKATALGLIAASRKSGLKLHYASYPITPASDILHELAKHKNYGVQTFQAEDEIAAACSAIGASFGGALGVCSTSGPGMSLKSEAIGLAVMLELPLVICDIQRAGPSTGMPTKTEQSDLLLALYGRNGESPLPVIASKSPADCFSTVFDACRIAIEHMTPVIFLSDAYNANGSQPWQFPSASDLPEIRINKAIDSEKAFQAYKRDDRLVRSWALPGNQGFEHRIGGLEKDVETGNVSYDPNNHEQMVMIREAKVRKISERIPRLETEPPVKTGELLILGWGSTYGSIRSAVRDLHSKGYRVAHLHLRHLNPFPDNLAEVLQSFDKILLPEMNMGQLALLLKAKFQFKIHQLNKVQGVPFTGEEIEQAALKLLKSNEQ